MIVSLVGLPGVGKSTVGRRLAKQLGVAFADCDSVLEHRFGEPVASYFEREGEAAFREAERTLLREMVDSAATSGAVIATGGGVVVCESNRRLLRERTCCIWLDAEPDSLLGRLRRSDRRPLLRVPDLRGRLIELARERSAWYAEAAAIRVSAMPDARSTLASIQKALALKALPTSSVP